MITVVEELHGAGYTDIILTTNGATAIGQWLVAIQGCDFYNASDLLSPSPGAWALVAGDGNLSSGHPHVKVWMRQVTVAGANSVTFDQALDSGNHAHLRVITGVASFDVGAGTFSSSSVSHVCPSLITTAIGDWLINASIGLTNGAAAFDYTAPSGMVETDVSTFSTMGSHSETLVAAGATGTRTHTASIACEYASVSVAIKAASGAPVELEGVSSSAASADGVITADRSLAGNGNAANQAVGALTVQGDEGIVTAPLTTEYGPCAPWPVRWSCDVSTVSPIITGQAVQFATEVVWALSGRQFGLCTVTLRPCRRECFDDTWSSAYSQFPSSGDFVRPALIGGRWFNLICGGCGDGCSCSRVSEVVLPAPVNRIIEVKVDGAPLATGAYRLDNARLLVRIDGGEWPICNDLSRNDTEEGTWSITAEYGTHVPEGGAWAVGELACELIAAIGGGDCRLPRNITQLARQGVTISFPNVVELFKERATGLYLVDLFISTWNPNRLTARSGVYSVDGAISRRAGT